MDLLPTEHGAPAKNQRVAGDNPPNPRHWIFPSITFAASLAGLAAAVWWRGKFTATQASALAMLVLFFVSALAAMLGAKTLRSLLLAWTTCIFLEAVWILANGSIADSLKYMGVGFLLLLAAGIGWTFIQELSFCMKAPKQPLLDKRLAELKQNGVHPSLRSLRSESTGLVLAGGGGKGAYQIGALSALSEFGISDFAGIAGTSVGALNGVLIAQGDLRAAQDIWNEISPGKVLGWPLLRFPIAIVTRLLVSPFLLFRKRVDFWQNAATYDSPKSIIYTTVNFMVSAVFAMVLFGIFVVLAPRGSLSRRELIQFIPSEVWMSLICCALAIIWTTLRDLHKLSASKLSLFSNAPLFSMIRKTVSAAMLRSRALPVYVTHAALGYQSRPLKQAESPVVAKPMAKPPTTAVGRWWQEHVTGVDKHYRSRDFVSATFSREESLSFVPRYINLLQRSDQEIDKMVLQSAALPEVFPQHSIDGWDVVDGGVADNVPWSPLLQQPGICNIIAIYLKKAEPAGPLLYRELESVSRRAAWTTQRPEEAFSAPLFGAVLPGLVEMPVDKVSTRRVDPLEQNETNSVLLIQPSIHPGNLLGGTMNFFGYKARALMRLGFLDTLNALEQGLSDLTEVRSRVLRQVDAERGNK